MVPPGMRSWEWDASTPALRRYSGPDSCRTRAENALIFAYRDRKRATAEGIQRGDCPPKIRSARSSKPTLLLLMNLVVADIGVTPLKANLSQSPSCRPPWRTGQQFCFRQELFA